MSVASQKPLPSMLISVLGTGKNHLRPGQKSMGGSPVLSHRSLLRNPWPRAAGMLEHCLEEEINCRFSIFQDVSFWPDVTVHYCIPSFVFRDESIMDKGQAVKNSCKWYQSILKLLRTFTNRRHFRLAYISKHVKCYASEVLNTNCRFKLCI